jgi:hypothetical protein
VRAPVLQRTVRLLPPPTHAPAGTYATGEKTTPASTAELACEQRLIRYRLEQLRYDSRDVAEALGLQGDPAGGRVTVVPAVMSFRARFEFKLGAGVVDPPQGAKDA